MKTINNIKLTANELAVMTACTETEYTGCPWNWAVQLVSGVPEKAYRGVVSSLIKKGLCQIDDAEGHNHPTDMVFVLSDLGAEINRTIHAQAAATEPEAVAAEVVPEPVAEITSEVSPEPAVTQVGDVIKMSVRGLHRPFGTEGMTSITLGGRCFFIKPGTGDGLPTLISTTNQTYAVKEHSKRPGVLFGERTDKKGQYAGSFMQMIDGELTALPK